MNGFAEIWHLTRERLTQVYEDLNDQQLNWRPFPGGHTTFEYLYHVAGVEMYYVTVLTDREPKDELERKLYGAFANTFLKEGEFPFEGEDLTKQKVAKVLDYTFNLLKPLIENADDALLDKPIVSAQNLKTNGRGGLTRVAQHAGYHTGQIYLMRCDPEFPK